MKIFLLIILILISSCSSRTYRGDRPNTKLRGEPAKQEIDRYTLWPKSFFSSSMTLALGPKARLYSYASLRDNLLDISPRSKAPIEKIQKWQNRKTFILWASLAGYLYGSVIPDTDKKALLTTLSALGFVSGFGIHLYQVQVMRKIPSRFNSDLERTLSPGVFWESNF